MAATLLLLLATAASGARLGELARRDNGDIFTILGLGDECDAAQCAEHGAGAGIQTTGACACACPQRAPLFREDRELCVDDLPECALASFGTGSTTQRIPFVYLPLKGQIIHPSKEITFENVKTPICAVSGAQFLTRKGFLDLRNTVDADVPFNLFRDEGRTFLQWSGEDEMRARMTGRVMVVRLLCRDVSATPTSPLDLRGVFTPCVAFRVQGTPPKPYTNMTEVQFAPNAQTSESAQASGLSISEYVAIAISSLLLGLIYVASVFLFLHIRKRRKANSTDDGRRLKGLKKKDGTHLTERDIVRVNNERMQNLQNVMGQDDGFIKKNPLLGMSSRQLHEAKNYCNDSSSNLSDFSDEFDSVQCDDIQYSNQTTSAVVHQYNGNFRMRHDNLEFNHRDESGIERLPDEHVSIVETIDDREIARPVGTTRRKLYFNPAYFEPQFMADPPAAALEFLVKIREVISIAKHKMAAKRFQPILNKIPEEETLPSTGDSIDLYRGMGSQRSGSLISLKKENSRNKNCIGCPGCKTDNENDVHNKERFGTTTCANCLHNKGDKQNSIRKWLENVPTVKQHALYNDLSPANQNHLAESLLSLPCNDTQRTIRKPNSFPSSCSINLSENYSVPKKCTTLSVKSAPITRNYDLPLPSFENVTSQDSDYNFYCQTIAQVDDIRPIGFNQLSNTEKKLIPQKFVNKNALPDMVNEAIALDNCSNKNNDSDEEHFCNKTSEVIVENTFSRNTSESPPANDYETDSLERANDKKELCTSTEFMEVSSQASPSLSNALPLDEELTMRNAVYKPPPVSNSSTPSPHRDVSTHQNIYDHFEHKNHVTAFELQNNSITDKNLRDNLVTEVYVNNYNFGSVPTSPSDSDCTTMGSRKLGRKPTKDKPGCLTIEVKDPPENYIRIHESDGFEPDTLDRKHPKYHGKESLDNIQFSRKNVLKNIDNNSVSISTPQHIQLRSSGTFIRMSDKNTTIINRGECEPYKSIYDRPRLSARVIGGHKILEETTNEKWQDAEDWAAEEGRILTLELRHSKRQRQIAPSTIKQTKILARPDVLPPLTSIDDDPIYVQPVYPPRKVETDKVSTDETNSKNLNGRSLSPRFYLNNTASESTISTPESLNYGLSCSPTRASVHPQSSEYVNVESVNNVAQKSAEVCRNFNRKPSDGVHNINTNTFVKGVRNDCYPKTRIRRKKSNVQDSGYLSSDSTSSRQMQRKLVVAKMVSCSESDDTENEAQSESGAESIETHSVYFDCFRKMQMQMQKNLENSYSIDSKSSRDSSDKLKHSDEYL